MSIFSVECMMESVTILVVGFFFNLYHCCRCAILVKTECWFGLYLFTALFQTQYLSIRSKIKIRTVPYSEQSFEPSDCL